MPNAAPWLDFGTTALYYCGMAEREKYQTPFFFLWIWIGLSAVTQAETLTISPKQRPEWFTRDGIVMAGSWEPLYFRVRRDGASGYEPTAEQRAAYRQERAFRSTPHTRPVCPIRWPSVHQAIATSAARQDNRWHAAFRRECGAAAR